jgi:hypothetical protein
MCVRRSDGGVFPPLQVFQERLAITKAKLISDSGSLEDDSVAAWSARLEMCQWRRETLDKESIWDEARSTSLSKW